MPVQLKSLALNDLITGTAAASTDTVYTASNGIAQIDQATAYNTSASAVTLHVYILAPSVAATAAAPIVSKSVGASAGIILSELIAHKVPSGGSIQAYAGTTDVIRLSVSGVEVQ
jgi:hypothetical protein